MVIDFESMIAAAFNESIGFESLELSEEEGEVLRWESRIETTCGEVEASATTRSATVTIRIEAPVRSGAPVLGC